MAPGPRTNSASQSGAPPSGLRSEELATSDERRGKTAVIGAAEASGASRAPETILTERNREQIPAEMQTTLADSHPLKRLGTPQDVATAAAFLASAEAAWITGVVIDVAGGAVMV